MAKIEKVDTDIALALKFFGIQSTEIDKAKDIKWLEKQNVLHQLNRDKKEQSNQHFSTIKKQQHRLDFVASQLSEIESFEKEEVKSTSAPKAKWYENSYKPEGKKEMNSDLQEFKDSIEKSFLNVSMKDGEINTRSFNYSKEENDDYDTNSYTPKYVKTNNNRACGSTIAGAWLSLIGAIILIIASFSYYSVLVWYPYLGWVEEFSMVGPILTGLGIWTASANSRVINRTAKSRVGAGVLGLLFGFFLGGLLTLCGRYDEY